MQSLIVVLVLCAGAVFANNPVIYNENRDGSSSENHQYPLASSEYLKRVLGRDSSMRDDDINPETMLEINYYDSPAESALNLLSMFGLHEADKIAKRINLKQYVQNLDSVTLFVPNDYAIDNWKNQVPTELAENDEVLTRLAQAWIVPKMVVRFEDFLNEMQLPTLATDVKLRVNVYEDSSLSVKVMTANGAQIVRGNYKYGDIIIHALDKMIFPLPDGDVIHTLAQVEDFSIFFDLVKKSGLHQFLAECNGLTMFAPVNRAFDLVPSSIMADLAANKTKLQGLVNYHIVPKTYYTTAFSVDGQCVNRVGKLMTIDYENDKYVVKSRLDQSQDTASQAEILFPDIPTSNGVIHVIDKVLSIKSSRH